MVGSKKAFCQRRATTSACMNAAMLFERADEVVLPAVYRFVARSFNATPSQVRLLHRLLRGAMCAAALQAPGS